MKNTEYTASDKEAVVILRAAYTQVYSVDPATIDTPRASDILYDARQYLQDRSRYARLPKNWNR